MLITLNSELQPVPFNTNRIKYKSEQTISAIKYKAATTFGEHIKISDLEIVTKLQSHTIDTKKGILDTISTAYDHHLSLIINPHDLWYIVLTQIAEEVNTNVNLYRELFTTSDDKQLITVLKKSGSEDIDVQAIIEKLKAFIPGGPEQVSLFLPELSTLTIPARLAHAAAFASTVKQYYDYGMFCCGIPEIELRGLKSDWQLLIKNLSALTTLFIKSSKMVTYLIQARQVFDSIVQSYDMDDFNVEFWKDIYTHKNVGSGGDLQVTGWIKQLFLNKHDLIKSFHDMMSSFEYIDLDTKQKYCMVHGAFGATVVDGKSIQPEYGYMTFTKAKMSLDDPEFAIKLVDLYSRSGV